MLGDRELGKQSSERLIPWQTLDRTHGAHDQKPRGLRAPSDETKPVQRRCVAPLQILQAQNERLVHGSSRDRIRELPQHALTCPTDRASSQRFELAIAQQCGQLSQPAGSMAAEGVQKAVGMRAATEARDRIEEG